ncbi:MAG: CAP domain-containing protein [Burkholderiaceae bacterium]
MGSQGSPRTRLGYAARCLAAVVLALGLATPGVARAADDGDDALREQADAILNMVRSRIADCGDGPRVIASASVSDAIVPETRPALRRNPMLEEAAARHAAAMARTRLFDHVGADGTTVRERVNATGYRWRVIGENLAAGHPKLEEAVSGWLASRSHCAALLDARYTEYGLARTVSNSPSDAYGIYWTLVLGQPR